MRDKYVPGSNCVREETVHVPIGSTFYSTEDID